MTSTYATRVDGKRAMVVDKEGRPFVPCALHTDPLSTTLPVIFRFHVLCHLMGAFVEQLPALRVSNAACMLSLNHLIMLQQALPSKYSLSIFTLLESHKIILLVVALAGDQPAGAVAVATPQPIEVPPEQVVRQNLDLHGDTTESRTPEVRRGAACAPLPLLSSHFLCRFSSMLGRWGRNPLISMPWLLSFSGTRPWALLRGPLVNH
mmetsp:Transcript_81568/g.197682  ORF Transcript_81568/g.197682 Transcript_81568/m.197682 type:complete len:207 (-) Transcript_81568:1000-1620(-)